jgi:hypothetical protein
LDEEFEMMLQNANVIFTNTPSPAEGPFENGVSGAVGGMHTNVGGMVVGLTGSPAKVADSTKRMWQRYRKSRLRDFAHSQ